MVDWNQYRDDIWAQVDEFAQLSPDVMHGLLVIADGAAKTGHLDPKVHELIALAVAVTTRCDGCISGCKVLKFIWHVALLYSRLNQRCGLKRAAACVVGRAHTSSRGRGVTVIRIGS